MRGVAGASLVELLLVLGLGGLLLQLGLALFHGSRSVERALSSSIEQHQRSYGVPALLQAITSDIGREQSGCVLSTAIGASQLAWWIHQADGGSVRVELFAALDAARRPALYLRQGGAARQPLLEEVTALQVVAARVVDADPRRWLGLDLELEWGPGERQRLPLSLRHRPCLEGP